MLVLQQNGRARMIRSASPDDASSIASIYNHYVEHTVVTFEVDPVPVPEMQRRIRTGMARYPWLVAVTGGEVTGYAYATQWKPRPAYGRTVETSVYVGPGHVGKGLGLALYATLLEKLRSMNFHCALGGIALPNEASVALHEKLGFRKVGELEEVGFKLKRRVSVGYWQLFLHDLATTGGADVPGLPRE